MPTPPPLPSRPDAASVALRMNDFPNRFSPMLVKELRQGMRTNLFSVAFILFQTVMILSLLAGLADPGSTMASGFFWFFVVVVLLVVQPLRGFGALSSEYLLNTMDLIQLTRLDAWRITLGKWTALNAQTLLFVTGVLPYLVMRYFLGNVNFVVDLGALGFLGLGSALASAITIGCSAFRHFVLRGILVVGFAIGFITLYSVVRMLLFRSGFGGGPGGATMALTALAMAYGCFFFLSFGASRIAPLSDNLATRKRLVALLFAGISMAFLPAGGKDATAAVVALILGFACIDALTEPLPVFARVLEPFRKNPLYSLAAVFLAPGWLSGIAFTLLCTAVWWVFLHHSGYPSSSTLLPHQFTPLTVYLSMANLLFFPLILIHLFLGKLVAGSHTFGIYVFIQASLGVLTAMIFSLAQAMPRHEGLVYAFVPVPSALLVAANQSGLDANFHLVYLAAAILTLLLGVLVPPLRHRSALEDFRRHLRSS